jgi:hypothetical protein
MITKKASLMESETFRKWFPWILMLTILIIVLGKLIKNVYA